MISLTIEHAFYGLLYVCGIKHKFAGFGIAEDFRNNHLHFSWAVSFPIIYFLWFKAYHTVLRSSIAEGRAFIWVCFIIVNYIFFADEVGEESTNAQSCIFSRILSKCKKILTGRCH